MMAFSLTPEMEKPLLQHQNVTLDTIHVLESSKQAESRTYLVPRSLSTTLASDQCCACPVFPAQDGHVVEMSAFIPADSPSCVNLHCEGVFVQQFPFRNDKLLSIKLLPLHSNQTLITPESTPLVGVILIVASLSKGLTIYSIVLNKVEGSDGFLPVERREFVETANTLSGRCFRSMAATVVNTTECARPFLLIAVTSSPEGQSPSDQRLDVQRYMLQDHQRRIFQYGADEACTEVSPWNNVVQVGDVGRVTAMTFGAVWPSNFCSLAVMTSTQLTLVQLIWSEASLKTQHSSKLLLTGCHPTHSLGAASMVVSLGFDRENAESFAVVCRPKSSNVAYTPTTAQSPLVATTTNTPDAFAQEAAAITNNSDSFFSPALSNRKSTSDSNIMIQQVKSNADTLIENTILSTVKDLQKLYLDDSLLIEQGASKITPVRKIVDITAGSVVSNALEVPADTCESALSPLMGLTLAEDVASCDESALMTSLLNVQAKTPVVSGGFSSSNEDHATHMILARVEYVGPTFQMKIYPMAMSIPEQMSGLEIISLRPLPAYTGEPGTNPDARGHVTFDDLMFSPSPGKMMSPAKPGMNIQLSLMCRSAHLQKLYCFILSSRCSKQLHVESETHFDLEQILSKSLAVQTKSLSMKGLTIDNITTNYNNGCMDYCNKVRLVLSMNAESSEDSNSASDSPMPINLSLHEDGSVFVIGLSFTMPLSTAEVQGSLETPAPDLQAILDKLSTFQKEIYRRMDTMENAIRENTEKLEDLETMLLKGGPRDQASF